MDRSFFIGLCSGLATLLCPFPALALQGAILGSLAGAGRSSVDVGESYTLNPASVAHLRGAAISFGSSSQQSNGILAGHSYRQSGWHLSLNENSPDSVIGTSIFLSQESLRNSATQNMIQFSDAWFSLGNFVFPHISVGIGYHYHASELSLESYKEHAWNFGFLWTPIDHLGIGFSFQNLGQRQPEIPANLTLGRTAGVGFLYLHDDYLRLRLDYSRTTHALETQTFEETAFGLENFMTEWVSARIGGALKKTDDRKTISKLTMGLGFSGPRFGIHYGYQQLGQDQQGTEHSVDFTIPF